MTKRPVYFAIIADRRSGSTLLAASLNRHREIHVSDEIFNCFAAIDGSIDDEIGYAATVSVYHRWRRSPHQPTTSAVGTLIHRWQAEIFPGLWELTRGLHTRFICLYRRNVLRQLVSELIAMDTGVWSCDPTRQLPCVTVDPDALRTFAELRARERSADLLFQPRIEFALEDLAANWLPSIERIQYYLGVEIVHLEQATQKQDLRPLRSVITNYHEIARCAADLGHPEWAEEDPA